MFIPLSIFIVYWLSARCHLRGLGLGRNKTGMVSVLTLLMAGESPNLQGCPDEGCGDHFVNGHIFTVWSLLLTLEGSHLIIWETTTSFGPQATLKYAFSHILALVLSEPRIHQKSRSLSVLHSHKPVFLPPPPSSKTHISSLVNESYAVLDLSFLKICSISPTPCYYTTSGHFLVKKVSSGARLFTLDSSSATYWPYSLENK